MAEGLTLYDVLHSLIDKRGATSENNAQEMHDAVEAHERGLPHGGIVADERATAGQEELAAQFDGVSDADLAEQAADGNADANKERQRRRAVKAVEDAKKGSKKDDG